MPGHQEVVRTCLCALVNVGNKWIDSLLARIPRLQKVLVTISFAVDSVGLQRYLAADGQLQAHV